MEDRVPMLLELLLNQENNLRVFLEFQSPFKPFNSNPKSLGKPKQNGLFQSFSKSYKKFRLFYFEIYDNIVLKYEDKSRRGKIQFLQCHLCFLKEQKRTISDITVYSLIFQTETEIMKISTEQNNNFAIWRKELRRYCKLSNFVGHYKVDTKLYNHTYKIIEKETKQVFPAKIINKRDLKPEHLEMINWQIMILRHAQKCMLPPLKRIFEDQNYIYLLFKPHYGDDMMKICNQTHLQEISISSITIHILKALKNMHSQNYFHGNLKLENILFIINQSHNQIMLTNPQYVPKISNEFLIQQIQSGSNYYVAPEVLEGVPCEKINSQIDLFALGVCIFYMVFLQFPYLEIKKSRLSQKYDYRFDMTCIDDLIEEQKQRPDKISHLSASGLDFLKKILDPDPARRLTATKAMNHVWLINVLSQPKENQKLQQFKDLHQMKSLNTILECSMVSEEQSMAGFMTNIAFEDYEDEKIIQDEKSQDSQHSENDVCFQYNEDEQEKNACSKMNQLEFWQPKFYSYIREKMRVQLDFRRSIIVSSYLEEDEVFQFAKRKRHQTVKF